MSLKKILLYTYVQCRFIQCCSKTLQVFLNFLMKFVCNLSRTVYDQFKVIKNCINCSFYVIMPKKGGGQRITDPDMYSSKSSIFDHGEMKRRLMRTSSLTAATGPSWEMGGGGGVHTSNFFCQRSVSSYRSFFYTENQPSRFSFG